MYFFIISWKTPGYLNNGTRWSFTSFQKGLLSNEIKLQTDNYTTGPCRKSSKRWFTPESVIISTIFFTNMYFAYRKNHGTDTALLSLTEKWRKELDQSNIIGIVSMDLSVSMDKATEQIHDYLTNRRQRVRLGDQLSNWKEISAGGPQGSVLGPLIFNIFMNDFVYAVKQSTLSAYADDIQIFSPAAQRRKWKRW